MDAKYNQLIKELLAARSEGRATAERLQSVRSLLRFLGVPHTSLKVVHVAGSNGKGSTCTLIARLLAVQTGSTVGLFTSPHLADIRERIVINGKMVSHAEFAYAVSQTLSAARQLEIAFSFFDLITAAALVVFARAKTSWAVLETGLGGAADATNAIKKQVAVITRLGLDHQVELGRSLHQIARQKIAIACPNAPVILARQAAPLEDWLIAQLTAQHTAQRTVKHTAQRTVKHTAQRTVKHTAQRTVKHTTQRTVPRCQIIKARLIKIRLKDQKIRVGWQDDTSRHNPICSPICSPIRFAQQETAPFRAALANALATGIALFPQATSLQRSTWLKSLLQVHLPARLDLRRNVQLAFPVATPVSFPAILLDGAHNSQSFAALSRQIRQWQLRPNQCLLVLAKQRLTAPISRSLNNILRHSQQVLLPALTDDDTDEITRSKIASPEQLKSFLQQSQPQLNITTFASLQQALQAAQPQLPLIITGSFWLLGKFFKEGFLKDDFLKEDLLKEDL